MIKISLIGIGKTGIEIAKVLLMQNDIELVSVMSSPNSSKKGQPLSEIIDSNSTNLLINTTDEIEDVILSSKPDIVIDFSNPKATIEHAKKLSELNVNMVIGTTGFSDDELNHLKNIPSDRDFGVVYAPNITLGVNVLMLLTKLSSILLSDYDFHIIESHHKAKVDIPSGTALKISNEIKTSLEYSGKDISDIDIPISAVRAGGIIGKHEVQIVGENDLLSISHQSFSRKAFALGAIQAIKYIDKKTGYHEMNDVLHLSKIIEDLYLKDKIN